MYFDNVFIKNPNIRNNSLFRFTWDAGKFPEMYRSSYFRKVTYCKWNKKKNLVFMSPTFL